MARRGRADPTLRGRRALNGQRCGRPDRLCGSLLAVQGGEVVADLQRGFANQSALVGEPVGAYLHCYTLDEYVDRFVSVDPDRDGFHYNNVDYVLHSKVIETVTGQTYTDAVRSTILDPLEMTDTDVVDRLAYEHHNYTFDSGGPDDPVRNDRRFVSDYYGAGQVYSTLRDLYLSLSALQGDRVLSTESRQRYLQRSQSDEWVDWLQGCPTYGFSHDDRTFAEPAWRRIGNLDEPNIIHHHG